MSARNKILSAIASGKPALTPLPVMSIDEVTQYPDPLQKFISTLESIGGKVIALQNPQDLELEIKKDMDAGLIVLSTVDQLQAGTTMVTASQSATELAMLHKAYIRASIGVAENGAVWIMESQMINRLLPFICQHLVIVLDKNRIVSTMQHAYRQIDSFGEGFGVFLAGPSKTADIEQALVIGAHGARSLTLYLTNGS